MTLRLYFYDMTDYAIDGWAVALHSSTRSSLLSQKEREAYESSLSTLASLSFNFGHLHFKIFVAFLFEDSPMLPVDLGVLPLVIAQSRSSPYEANAVQH